MLQSISKHGSDAAEASSPLFTFEKTRHYIGGDRPVSKDTIYRLIAKGKLVSVMISPRIRRITRASCDAYIAELVEAANQETFDDND